jgi:flagellar basal body rod protein FlgC
MNDTSLNFVNYNDTNKKEKKPFKKKNQIHQAATEGQDMHYVQDYRAK